MRLRDPILGGALSEACVQRMNWVTNQTLPNRVWAYFLGIAEPTFFLDAQGRAAMADVRYRTGWTDMDEKFVPGLFMDVQDEAWSAILTSVFGDEHDLLSVSLAAYGSDLEVYVGDVRQRFAADLAPFATRLVLPHETRSRRWAVRGADACNLARPILLAEPPQRDPGADIYNHEVEYDLRGRCVFIPDHDDAPGRDWSIIDVLSCDFGRDGVSLTRYNPNYVRDRLHDARRCSGEFWLSRFASDKLVAPAHSPAMHALFSYLTPVHVDVEAGLRRGYPTNNVTSGTGNADPNTAVNPADNVFGNIPVHESGQLSQAALAKEIANLDPEMQKLLMMAFIKTTYGDGAETVLSGLTSVSTGTSLTAPTATYRTAASGADAEGPAPDVL